jgi:hypothetical protein
MVCQVAETPPTASAPDGKVTASPALQRSAQAPACTSDAIGACGVRAICLGSESRNPSGPAVIVPRRQGRTHGRNRRAHQISHLFSCIQGALHTCANAPSMAIGLRGGGPAGGRS